MKMLEDVFPTKTRMFDALGLDWAVMLMNTPVLKMALWIVRCRRTG